MSGFEPGTLWARARERSRHARRTGALRALEVQLEVLEERGIPFAVRRLASRDEKPRSTSPAAAQRNPFLPVDEALRVAEVSETHLCVLNKFPALDTHLLLVTRRFEPQDAPLSVADFDAWWRCLAEGEALGFYNSGPVAGASQTHRHLQLVPPPVGCGPEPTPLDRVLPRAGGRARFTVLERLPFRHALRLLPAPGWTAVGAELMHATYRELARRCGDPALHAPYNLLLTRRWMLLVPRRSGSCQGIEVNGLGFAGSLLVRDAAQLACLRRIGPLRLLSEVAWPPL